MKCVIDNKEIEINFKQNATASELAGVGLTAYRWFLNESVDGNAPIEFKDLIFFATTVYLLSDYKTDENSLDNLTQLYNAIWDKIDLGKMYNDVKWAYDERIYYLTKSQHELNEIEKSMNED